MYRIYQFGTTPLPPAMPEDDLSTGTTESTLVDSIGGVFDAWGTKRRLPRRQVINLSGMFELSDNGRFPDGQPSYLIDHLGNYIVDHLGNRIIIDSPSLSLRRNRDLLTAQEGTVQALYRRREDDSLVEFKFARLLKVGQIRTINDAGAVARMEMTFETRMAAWRNNTQTIVSAAMPASLMLVNNGDITVTDAVLLIIATGTITSIVVTGPGISLTWTGAMASGQQLLISCGGKTVTIGGADNYNGFLRGVGHTVAGWLPIAQGTSLLTVTANGPGTASLSFYEQRF